MNEKIPKPVTPFLDERTGKVSREWFLYLASIGVDASEDDDILFWACMHT